jgi:hypothetical protein
MNDKLEWLQFLLVGRKACKTIRIERHGQVIAIKPFHPAPEIPDK